MFDEILLATSSSNIDQIPNWFGIQKPTSNCFGQIPNLISTYPYRTSYIKASRSKLDLIFQRNKLRSTCDKQLGLLPIPYVGSGALWTASWLTSQQLARTRERNSQLIYFRWQFGTAKQNGIADRTNIRTRNVRQNSYGFLRHDEKCIAGMGDVWVCTRYD